MDGDLPFTKLSFRESPPGYINNLDNGKIKSPHCCACELQNIQALAKNNVLTSTFVIDPRVSPTWNSDIIASITLTTTPPSKWPQGCKKAKDIHCDMKQVESNSINAQVCIIMVMALAILEKTFIIQDYSMMTLFSMANDQL